MLQDCPKGWLKFLCMMMRPALLAWTLVALGSCTQSMPSRVTEAAVPSAGALSAKIGTKWGEGVESRVTTASLRRIARAPLSVYVLNYSGADGRGERRREVQTAEGRVGLRVLKADGAAWPIYREAGGERLQGKIGERYVLEYRNYSATVTYEVIATVDGLDVLNGQRGSVRNSGYVLRPQTTLRIEGFRKSSDEVAAFRFSSAAESYAANSAAGSVQNVGVIGTAIFELNTPAPAKALPDCGIGPCAFSGDAAKDAAGYAAPPIYDRPKP